MRRLAVLGALAAALLTMAFALPGRASADDHVTAEQGAPTPVICVVFIPIGDGVIFVTFVGGTQITNPSGTLTVCRGDIPGTYAPANITVIEQGPCTLTLTPGGTFTYICRT